MKTLFVLIIFWIPASFAETNQYYVEEPVVVGNSKVKIKFKSETLKGNDTLLMVIPTAELSTEKKSERQQIIFIKMQFHQNLKNKLITSLKNSDVSHFDNLYGANHWASIFLKHGCAKLKKAGSSQKFSVGELLDDKYKSDSLEKLLTDETFKKSIHFEENQKSVPSMLKEENKVKNLSQLVTILNNLDRKVSINCQQRPTKPTEMTKRRTTL